MQAVIVNIEMNRATSQADSCSKWQFRGAGLPKKLLDSLSGLCVGGAGGLLKRLGK